MNHLQQPQFAQVFSEVRGPLDAQVHQALEGRQGLEEVLGDAGAVPEFQVGQVGQPRQVIHVGGLDVVETEQGLQARKWN